MKCALLFLLSCGALCLVCSTGGLVLFLLSLPLGAQVTQGLIAAPGSTVDLSSVTVVKPFHTVSVDPSGACSNAAAVSWSTASNQMFVCYGGTWHAYVSSGGSMPYGGTNIYINNHTVGAADIGKMIDMNCVSACVLSFEAIPASTDWWWVESTGASLATINLNGTTWVGPNAPSAPVLVTNQALFVSSPGPSASYMGFLTGGASGSSPIVTGSAFNLVPGTGILLPCSNVSRTFTCTPALDTSYAATRACLEASCSTGLSFTRNASGNYQATGSPTFTTYTINQTLTFVFPHNCDGSDTVNIDGLGRIPLQKLVSGSLVAVAVNDCVLGVPFLALAVGSPVTAYRIYP
jgi:hypothetical protein